MNIKENQLEEACHFAVEEQLQEFIKQYMKKYIIQNNNHNDNNNNIINDCYIIYIEKPFLNILQEWRIKEKIRLKTITFETINYTKERSIYSYKFAKECEEIQKSFQTYHQNITKLKVKSKRKRIQMYAEEGNLKCGWWDNENKIKKQKKINDEKNIEDINWHLKWQLLCKCKYTEVDIQYKFRADIVGNDYQVIELQHSRIEPKDIIAREEFYR